MYSRYGFFGLIKLFVDFAFTKLCYPRARILRRPVSIRGRKNIYIGNDFTTGPGLRLEAFALKTKKHTLTIGDNVQVNDYVHIAALSDVTIGKNVLIASKVFISDHNHGYYGEENIHDSPNSIPKDRDLSYSAVLIKDNVWIGENVAILKGVTIGFGCIIGANSVVNKSIGDNCIAVGSPARVVKKYNFSNEKWERV